MPTSHAHLDEEGAIPPASGEEPLGIGGAHQPYRDALCVEGGVRRLEYRVLEGSCDTKEVLGYLDALAEQAQRMNKPCVVVLDNAPFHTAGVVREREQEWEERGLVLCTDYQRILSAPEPHRGAVAKAQRLPDAAPILRFCGRVEAGCFAWLAITGSCGGSMFAWRYLAAADRRAPDQS